MSEEQVAEVSAPEMEQEVAQSVEDWRSSIPEEIRGHKSLDHINDVGALAKSYVHAQSMIGADKIAIPGKSATPDDWNEVYARLGRPADAESYELPAPENFEADPEMTSWYKQMAHDIGLNPTQAAKLYQSYNEFVSSQEQSMGVDLEQYTAQVESDLRRECGQAFEDRLAQGHGVVTQFGNPELMEVTLSDGTRLGDNPDFIRLMGEVGNFIQERVGEDTLEGVRTSGGITPDAAREKLAELRAPGGPFWDARHPEHDYYVQQALKFQEMIHS